MTENLNEIWRSYRPDNVTKNSIVIDIGSSDGFFTNWAISKGAKVESFDARVNCAVGPNDGFCEVKGEGYGAYIVPNQGSVKMISLKTILESYNYVDFLKCDIEGGEYLIFNCDLSKVRQIGLEFHAWTTPGKLVEGLGVKEEEMPKNAVDKLIKQLEKTHFIEIIGDKLAGGLMYGKLK